MKTKNKLYYYILVTLGFGALSVPSMVSIFFGNTFLMEIINKGIVGITLLTIVTITEVSLIEKRILKGIGWALIFVMFFGFMLRLMHWPFSQAFFLSGIGIAVILLISAIIVKSKDVFQYVLAVFIFERVLYYLMHPTLTFFMDLTYTSIGFLVGIVWIVKMVKAKN